MQAPEDAAAAPSSSSKSKRSKMPLDKHDANQDSADTSKKPKLDDSAPAPVRPLTEEERAKLPFFVDSGEACASCGGLDDAEGNQMLLCDAPGGCDVAYHQKCLTPALETVPEGDWLCPMHDPASSSYGKKAAAKSKSPAKEGPGGTRLGIDDCGVCKNCLDKPNHDSSSTPDESESSSGEEVETA